MEIGQKKAVFIKLFIWSYPFGSLRRTGPGTTSLGEHKQWNVTIQLNTLPSNLDLVAHSVQGQVNVQKHSRIVPKRL